MPLNDKDQLKGYSLMTKPYFTNLQHASMQSLPPLHCHLLENLTLYKTHLAAMLTSNCKFEADALLLSDNTHPPLIELLWTHLSPYLSLQS